MIFMFCTSLWSFEIALWIFLNVLIDFEHIPTSLSSLNLFKQNPTHFWTKFKLIITCPKPSKRKVTEGFTTGHSKGGLISESILILVLLPTKVAKSLPWAENLNNLFTVKGGKSKIPAQWRDLAPNSFYLLRLSNL